MNYLYGELEIGFIKYLKENAPHKIWWDFTCYIFDYSDFYFKIECVSEIADSQNRSDEAIIGIITRHNEVYESCESEKIICENKAIMTIYIVRVFLFFSTFREYTKRELLLNRIKRALNSLRASKPNVFSDLMLKSMGEGMEYTCHPQSDTAKQADKRVSNLIDCGLLIEIENRFLKCFVEGNGFGFHIWGDKFFFEKNEVKKISSEYELIEV